MYQTLGSAILVDGGDTSGPVAGTTFRGACVSCSLLSEYLVNLSLLGVNIWLAGICDNLLTANDLKLV